MANLRTNNLSGQGGRNAYSGSVFFDGTQSYLALDGSSDFAFGTADFTIEMWIKIDDDTNTNTIYDSRPTTNGAQIALFYSGSGNAIMFAHGGSVRITGTIDVGADHSWHHVVLARQSGSTKLFVDGVQDGSTYSDSTSYENPSNRPFIGASGGSTFLDEDTFFKGYISNVRVCIGHAVYFSNFTPPTSQLTPHFVSSTDKTALLCCQNSEDPTEDNSLSVSGGNTPKTITAAGGSYQTGNNSILKNSDFSQGTTGFFGDSGASISESGGVMTVTNGGGDNLYALKQNGALRIGGTYRCTATVTPTFASGNPVFRVRFGGSAESFVQTQATMSTGVAFRLDTGEKVADGTDIEIGSGNSSGITQFTITDLVVTVVNPPKALKVLPPVGVDAGNTFDGGISMNSSSWMYFPTGRTEERGRGRGLVGGGNTPGQTNTIQFVEIRTSGNSLDFGDLTAARQSNLGATASSTRGIWGGGQVHPANSDVIDFITIATQSNAIDFGNLTVARRNNIGTGDATRGLFAGGQTPTIQDVIDYVTIASVGNAIDFGNLSVARKTLSAASSPTRGLFFGGTTPSDSDVIDYVTIASAGNATDFGNLTVARYLPSGVSSNTRAVMMGGGSPSADNTIDFVTIATTGNATDFGDLISGVISCGSASNSILGLNMGGGNGNVNTIEFITIATTGSAADYGDLYLGQGEGAGCSDSHGGLT